MTRRWALHVQWPPVSTGTLLLDYRPPHQLGNSAPLLYRAGPAGTGFHRLFRGAPVVACRGRQAGYADRVQARRPQYADHAGNTAALGIFLLRVVGDRPPVPRLRNARAVCRRREPRTHPRGSIQTVAGDRGDYRLDVRPGAALGLSHQLCAGVTGGCAVRPEANVRQRVCQHGRQRLHLHRQRHRPGERTAQGRLPAEDP